MYLTLLFCVSWVIFFAVMLQLVDQRSSSSPQLSNIKPTQMKPGDDQLIDEVRSDSLYLKNWNRRSQKDDWARRRLAGVSLH